MKHATYVHAQQVMEHVLVEQVENIAVDREYVRRIVITRRPAKMLDASVTQVTKETNAKH